MCCERSVARARPAPTKRKLCRLSLGPLTSGRVAPIAPVKRRRLRVTGAGQLVARHLLRLCLPGVDPLLCLFFGAAQDKQGPQAKARAPPFATTAERGSALGQRHCEATPALQLAHA